MMQGNPFSGDNVRLPLFFCRRCTAPTRSEEAYLDELRAYVRQTEQRPSVQEAPGLLQLLQQPDYGYVQAMRLLCRTACRIMV